MATDIRLPDMPVDRSASTRISPPDSHSTRLLDRADPDARGPHGPAWTLYTGRCWSSIDVVDTKTLEILEEIIPPSQRRGAYRADLHTLGFEARLSSQFGSNLLDVVSYQATRALRLVHQPQQIFSRVVANSELNLASPYFVNAHW
jgi:hypothetical protein